MMTVTDLKQNLYNLKAYKEERVRIGKAVVQHQLVPDLIALCRPESGVSHQACWSLEQSFLLHEEACYPFIKEICQLYACNINSSGKRPLCKIASILTKKYYAHQDSLLKKILHLPLREKIVEGCFQELISTDKTANMAYAVYSLYELGKEFDWIYPELIPVLEQKLQKNYGNGFKSSAKRVLAKIEG